MAFLNSNGGRRVQFDTTTEIIETDTNGIYGNKIIFGDDLICYKGGALSTNKQTTLKDGEVIMTFKGTDENPYYILESIKGVGSYKIPEGTKIIKELHVGWNNKNIKGTILIPDSVIYIDKIDTYLLEGIITKNNIQYYPSKNNPYFIAIGTVNDRDDYCLDRRTVLIADDTLNQEKWTDIYIPDSVLHIGNCNLSCNRIRFSKNLITLGNFKSTNLIEIEFPNSLQYISNFDTSDNSNTNLNKITMSSKLYNNISWLQNFSSLANVPNPNPLNIYLEGTEKPIFRPVSLLRIINIYWNGKELKNTLYHDILQLGSTTYYNNINTGIGSLIIARILYLEDVNLFNESEKKWEENDLNLLKQFLKTLQNSYNELKNQNLISENQKIKIYIDKNVELTPEQVDYLLETYSFIDYVEWENSRYIPSLQSAIQHISKTGTKYQFIYDGLKYESVKYYDGSLEIRIKEVIEAKEFYNIYPHTSICEIPIWLHENDPTELSDNLTLNFDTEEDWWKLNSKVEKELSLSSKPFTVLINNKRITNFNIPNTITTLIPYTHTDLYVKNMEEIKIPESVTNMQYFIYGNIPQDWSEAGLEFNLKRITAPIQLFFKEGQFEYGSGPILNKIEELTLTGDGTARSLWSFGEKWGAMPLFHLKKLYFTGKNIDFGDFGGELLSLRELYLPQESYNFLPLYLYGLYPFKESNDSKIKLYFDNQQCSNYICNAENFGMTRILLVSNVLDLETITFGDKVDSGFDDLDFTPDHFTEFLFDVDDINIKNSSVYSTDGNGIVYISKNNKKYPMFAHPIKKDNISQLFITNNRTFWMESCGLVTKPTQLNIFFTGDDIKPHLFHTFNLPNINTIKICDSDLDDQEHYRMTEKNTNTNLLNFTDSSNPPDASCYIHLENSEGSYWNYYTIEDKTVYFQKDGITALWYVAQNADWKNNTYVLPERVTNIAEGAFTNNRSIKTLVIHENITTLPDYFLQNTNIENVYLKATEAVTWKPLLDSSEVGYLNTITLRQQFNDKASSLDEVIIKQKPIIFYVPSISIKEVMENDPIWKQLLEYKLITIEVGVYTSTTNAEEF